MITKGLVFKEEWLMDNHYFLVPYNEEKDTEKHFLISNCQDDVIETVAIRCYNKEHIPEIKGLLNRISFSELKDIMENFIRICEKDQEFDKVGESYYIAKRWIRNLGNIKEE